MRWSWRSPLEVSIETILVTIPVEPEPFERRRLSPVAVLKGRPRESTRRHASHAHHSYTTAEKAVWPHPLASRAPLGKPFFGHKSGATPRTIEGGVGL